MTDNFGKTGFIKLPHGDQDDHLGGDSPLKKMIFRNPSTPDPLKQSADVRDGAMAILIALAAHRSIDSGKVVILSDLADLVNSNVGGR